jgi:hypothetical protein
VKISSFVLKWCNFYWLEIKEVDFVKLLVVKCFGEKQLVAKLSGDGFVEAAH